MSDTSRTKHVTITETAVYHYSTEVEIGYPDNEEWEQQVEEAWLNEDNPNQYFHAVTERTIEEGQDE